MVTFIQRVWRQEQLKGRELFGWLFALPNSTRTNVCVKSNEKQKGLASFLLSRSRQPRRLHFDLAQQPLRRRIQLLEHPVDLTHDRAGLDVPAFIQVMMPVDSATILWNNPVERDALRRDLDPCFPRRSRHGTH